MSRRNERDTGGRRASLQAVAITASLVAAATFFPHAPAGRLATEVDESATSRPTLVSLSYARDLLLTGHGADAYALYFELIAKDPVHTELLPEMSAALAEPSR